MANFLPVYSRIEGCSKATPEACAIDEGNARISYADLWASSGRLAKKLSEYGCSTDSRIGLLLNSSICAVQAILGTLRCGSCYFPLNPSYPPLYLVALLKQSDATAIVTRKKNLKMLPKVLGPVPSDKLKCVAVLDMKKEQISEAMQSFLSGRGIQLVTSEELGESEEIDNAPPVHADSPAYIMYSSSTTGMSKGTIVTHANINNLIEWARDYFSMQSSDRVSGHSSISFDLSVFDIFVSLSSGATLCPVTEPKDATFPGMFIRDRKITVWHSVPSVIGMMRKSFQLMPNAFSATLRLALFSGEAMSPDYAASWMETHPTVPIYNMFGPTECTVVNTCFRVGEDLPFDPTRPVPVGKVIPGNKIRVLKDHSLEEAKPGTPGRIMIFGKQISKGYFKNEELTRLRFLKNPFNEKDYPVMFDSGDIGMQTKNGTLIWLGRHDHQVKIMGYRVELGEIEALIGSHPQIEEIIVLAYGKEIPRLIAAVVANTEDEDELREELIELCREHMPELMVPKEYSFYEQLPRNENGRIDRERIYEDIPPDEE